MRNVQHVRSFMLPTPQGGEVELARSSYDRLVENGGLSVRSLSAIVCAAQILDVLRTSNEPLSIFSVAPMIRGAKPEKPSNTERRAMAALSKAKLVRQVGAGSTTKYVAVEEVSREEV